MGPHFLSIYLYSIEEIAHKGYLIVLIEYCVKALGFLSTGGSKLYL